MKSAEQKWRDDELSDNIELYGQSWSKGYLLRSIITHEIHHRAQLIVVMRFYGLKVPGIYGPAKEEWAKFNMPAME